MYKGHIEPGIEIVKENLIKKQDLKQIHLTLKSRGYSENDIFLCYQAGLILFQDREKHETKCLEEEKSRNPQA